MLSKTTKKILQNHDMTIFNREKQQGQFYREIEFYSDAGEDVIKTIWYDGTNAGFINAFAENAETFDPDEHAEIYVENRGKNGIPDSIRTLIDDADWIKNKLIEVAAELQKKHKRG